MKKLMIKTFFVTSCLLSLSAYAEDITIHTEDFPAETEKVKENEIGGLGGEVMTKALAAKKITYKVSWEPWKRAQAEVMTNADKKSFIIPLTRNSEREKNYVWVSKIYSAETAFISLKKGGKFDSTKEANGSKIGVLLGSSYENFLLETKSGIDKSDIESVPIDNTNAKKLDQAKISAWYTGVIGAIAIIKAEKLGVEKFHVGMGIDTEENYIATMSTTPKDLIDKVKAAVEDFKKTPEYASLVKKYTGK